MGSIISKDGSNLGLVYSLIFSAIHNNFGTKKFSYEGKSFSSVYFYKYFF